MNADIGEFITAARACIHLLLENAVYVRQELPNVSLPEPLQRDVEALCGTWLAAKHDALSDLDGIAEAVESAPGPLTSLTSRCRRVHGILGDVFEPTDQVVRQLREAAFIDPRLGLAALLVMESARNIMVTLPVFVVTDQYSADASEDDNSTKDLDHENSAGNPLLSGE